MFRCDERRHDVKVVVPSFAAGLLLAVAVFSCALLLDTPSTAAADTRREMCLVLLLSSGALSAVFASIGCLRMRRLVGDR